MATRGIVQLRKLTLKYCEYGGSSKALREYISNGKLALWATQHPHTEVEVKVHNGHHPLVKGEYITGNVQHQVSVKNYDRWQDVQDVCQMLADRSGRKITKITTPVLTDTPSIQGIWTPFLNLQHEPDFDITIHEGQSS
jgi:large subunit ribosomal protein L43